MSQNNQDVLLNARGICKTFPGVRALHQVDFSLRRGEIMALLGENGAGKSTLIKTLTGVYQPDGGRIELDGVPISPTDTAHAQRLGIGTVYQEVNLLPNMSVADNLFIGHEPRRFGLIDRAAMNRQAQAIMAGYGFEMDVTLPLGHHSVAMQQIVAIARAISLSARILILDEPTASLDASEVQMLFSLMGNLRDQGVSLIFITHFLDQVYAISDRITVLRNGELVGTRDTAALPQLDLVKMMLGRELDDNALKRAGKTLRSNQPMVSFRDYGKRGVIAPFSLDVMPGEIVGLAGLLGSGRTETAELMFGIVPRDGGECRVRGKPVTIRSARQAAANGFGFCPEDRKNAGIIASASVRENMVLALQAQRGWLRPCPARSRTRSPLASSSSWRSRPRARSNPSSFSPGGTSRRCCWPAGCSPSRSS
ncbi:sugar ABC transporter ATP-binding protein [Aeromonas media]|uniref:sugar ABC transporter ATP-binding protein n=1 Tax=Aeromonas media TaxID=651 RepID=UPI003D2490CF